MEADYSKILFEKIFLFEIHQIIKLLKLFTVSCIQLQDIINEAGTTLIRIAPH